MTAGRVKKFPVIIIMRQYLSRTRGRNRGAKNEPMRIVSGIIIALKAAPRMIIYVWFAVFFQCCNSK